MVELLTPPKDAVSENSVRWLQRQIVWLDNRIVPQFSSSKPGLIIEFSFWRSLLIYLVRWLIVGVKLKYLIISS